MINLLQHRTYCTHFDRLGETNPVLKLRCRSVVNLPRNLTFYLVLIVAYELLYSFRLPREKTSSILKFWGRSIGNPLKNKFLFSFDRSIEWCGVKLTLLPTWRMYPRPHPHPQKSGGIKIADRHWMISVYPPPPPPNQHESRLQIITRRCTPSTPEEYQDGSRLQIITRQCTPPPPHKSDWIKIVDHHCLIYLQKILIRCN